MSSYQSDFRRWLEDLGKVSSLGIDRWRTDTALTTAQVIARLPELWAQGTPGFPAECPVSAGEGAQVVTADGRVVAVYVEGWSSTCLGDNDPADIYDLGSEVISRWEKELSKWEWKTEMDEAFMDDHGLTVWVATRRLAKSKKKDHTPPINQAEAGTSAETYLPNPSVKPGSVPLLP